MKRLIFLDNHCSPEQYRIVTWFQWSGAFLEDEKTLRLTKPHLAKDVSSSNYIVLCSVLADFFNLPELGTFQSSKLFVYGCESVCNHVSAKSATIWHIRTNSGMEKVWDIRNFFLVCLKATVDGANRVLFSFVVLTAFRTNFLVKML